MANIEGFEMPDDLYYHKEHMWVRVEANIATIGLTDFNQKLAGEISYIEMPEEGREVKQDQAIGTYETGKWRGKLYAPLSGKIVTFNEKVEDDPTLANADPYGQGWLFKIMISSPSEINNLMKGSTAIEWLKEEIAKHVKKK